MGAAAGDAELLDLRSADGTGLARMGEDLELVLKLAALAEGVVVRVEGRTPHLDSPIEYVAGRGEDLLYLYRVESVRLAGGMNPGDEEDLIHVDVAETRHDRLVEQQALYGGLTVFKGFSQILQREISRE